MTRDERLQTAIQHHRANRLAEAETVYRQILHTNPNDPDALHLLGVLTGQRGDIALAIDLIQQAIHLKPDAPEPHRNLAALLITRGGFAQAAAEFEKVLQTHPTDSAAHRQLGDKFSKNRDFQLAVAAFSKAIELKPDFAEAHNDLGTILSLQNRLDEAIAAYTKATALKPKFPEAYYSLANALSRKDRIDEALAANRRAAEIKPDFAQAHLNTGNLLRRRGQLTEAIVAYKRAVQAQPNFAAAYFNLGQALRSAGLFEQSLNAFTSAAQIDPNYGEAWLAKAVVLADLQRFDEARAAQSRGAALMPHAAAPHDALGQIALLEGNPTAAIQHFRAALAIDPTLETAWTSLGVALQSQGNFEEAAKCFRKKLEFCSDAEVGRGYVSLTNAGEVAANADDLQRLTQMLDDTNSPTDNRVAAGFALGKILDKADQFDDAFAAYSKANLLWKNLRESVGDRYDPQGAARQTNRTIQTFNRQYIQANAAYGDPSDLPVFVVGMPRSGTTLVQQIVASHPQVHGAGELNNIGDIASRPDFAAMKPLAIRHLQSLRAMNPSALRVIDKTPSNIKWLGEIAVLFPDARVIFCRRDPLDTCLSCYFQWFTQGNLFSFDLLHCGNEYLQTERLRTHWLQVLPLKMLEVTYEALVTDLEGQSRRLIDFLGLPWNPACLDFHHSRTMVLTASAWQVRQPIYQTSVGRWRHYERYLEPLKNAIDNIKT